MSRKTIDLIKERHYREYKEFSISRLCILFKNNTDQNKRSVIAQVISEKDPSQFEICDIKQLEDIINFMTIEQLRNLANNNKFDTYRHKAAKKRLQEIENESTSFDFTSEDLIRVEQYYMNLGIDELCLIFKRSNNYDQKQLIVHVVAFKEPSDKEICDIYVIKDIIKNMGLSDLWHLAAMKSKSYRCLYARELLEDIISKSEIELQEENQKKI